MGIDPLYKRVDLPSDCQAKRSRIITYDGNFVKVNMGSGDVLEGWLDIPPRNNLDGYFNIVDCLNNNRSVKLKFSEVLKMDISARASCDSNGRRINPRDTIPLRVLNGSPLFDNGLYTSYSSR